MFFSDILIKSNVLREVWRIATSNNQVENMGDDNVSLPIICEQLDRWVDSDDLDVRNRLSLRTSAVLIDGATKLYKKQMQKLVEDVVKLDQEIVVRNRTIFTKEEEESSESSSDIQTPEQMMRQAEVHADISIEANEREPTFSPPAPDKFHSFSTSYRDLTKTSKSTKRNSDSIESSYHSPKKRLTISNQSNKTDENCDSDNPISQPQISDETSDNQSDEETDDNSAESDVQSEKTNDGRSETSQETQSHSSNQKVQTDSNESSEGKTSISHQVTDNIRSKNSPTFTDIFDVVVGLPNNGEKTVYIDVKTNSTISTNRRSSNSGKNTRKSDSKTVDRTSDDKPDDKSADKSDDKSADKSDDKSADKSDDKSADKSDDKSADKSDDKSADKSDDKSDSSRRASELSRNDLSACNDDDESQKSVILMSARERAITKVRRNKKRSKSTTIKKDQATQFDSFYPQMSDREGNTSNRTRPFGYLLIHESYDSRIPSKIIFSSLTDNVNLL